MQKKHRIFIAINLPEEIKRELLKYSEKWPELQARWTKKENLHITLEFLGDLTDPELGEVCLALKDSLRGQDIFDININKIVYGPPQRKSGQAPKMIWAVGDQSKELALLRQKLEKALLQKVSFVPEGRGSSPHITLARLSTFSFRQMEQEEIPEINEFVDLVFTIESIEVMESELKKGGPVYTILESEELGSLQKQL